MCQYFPGFFVPNDKSVGFCYVLGNGIGIEGLDLNLLDSQFCGGCSGRVIEYGRCIDPVVKPTSLDCV